jgi:hypothetical protein
VLIIKVYPAPVYTPPGNKVVLAVDWMPGKRDYNV